MIISDEEQNVLIKLQQIYKDISSTLKNNDEFIPDKVNYHNLCVHGTNGFVLLLALITDMQLLPSNVRDQKLIPTVTGEATFEAYKDDKLYHHYWKNFVASFTFDEVVFYPLETLNKYSKLSSTLFCKQYDAFEEQFSKILQNKNAAGIFNTIDKNLLQGIYSKLSAVAIKVVGEGIGYAGQVHSMPCEHKYEQINIKAVIIPDKDRDLIQALFSTLTVQNIGLINEKEYNTFHRERDEAWCTLIFKFINPFEKKFANNLIRDIHQENPIELAKYSKIYGYDSQMFIEKYGATKLRDLDSNCYHYPKRSNYAQDFATAFLNEFYCSFYLNDETYKLTKTIQYIDNQNDLKIEEVIITYYSSDKVSADQSYNIALSGENDFLT